MVGGIKEISPYYLLTINLRRQIITISLHEFTESGILVW